VLPAVPTLAEAGVPGVDVTSWNGISVPAATPQAVVEQLSSAVRQAVATPTVRRELLALGIETDASGPQAMTRRLREDIARWATVIDKLGIERQ
jgi:tripartite-type tricarboxylate transporter receptor subunit TctC